MESPPRLNIEKAISIAAADIGIKKYDHNDIRVQQIALGDESIPFIRDSLKGKPAYRIVFRNVDLAKSSGIEEAANPFVKTIVAIVSPDTERTIKVCSVWPAELHRIADMPTCREVERQLGDSEQIVGLPLARPRVNLIEALLHSMPWSRNVKNWFQNREGEAPAEPKRMGNRTIHAAQEDLRPPMPSMIPF